MSLYTRRGRVDVSTSDSEINSVASSGDQSPDQMIEELARMALAGRYYGPPKTYETNEMLRGHGMARRPRASEPTAAPSASPPPGSTTQSAGPSPRLGVRQDGLARLPPFGTTPHTLGTPRRTSSLPLRGSARQAEDADANADIARALARMYRHLAREYATEMKRDDTPARTVKSKSVGDDGVDGDPPKKKAAKRRPDEAALARLLTRNKVHEQRQAEKYHTVKERAEEARKHPKRIRVSQKAVALGKRLYLEAAEKQRNVKEQQAEVAEQQATAEKAACTFHPTISRYAERLAAREGHYSVEDRLEDQPLREQERQRLIIDRAVEQEKAFTFHPVLSIGTQELIARQRSRSRRREPFEPGERLYRDGAERLLRQQIRQQRAVSRQQRRVVGGQLRLSAEEAQVVVGRFAAWADARTARNAVRQDETERLARGETSTPPALAAVHRSPSRRTASTARPRNSPFSSKLEDSCAAKREGRETQAGQTPTLHNDALSLSASPRQTKRSTSARPSGGGGGGVLSVHGGSLTGTSTLSHDGTEESVGGGGAAWRDPPWSLAAQKEQLRVRLGALFYKYAVTPTATTVSPAEVRYQAQCYYPEDAGVADALDAAFDDAEQRLSKVDFMAALARYVAQRGPQTWCMPQRPRSHMQPTPAVASSCVHGGGSDHLATFLERLNKPTSSGGSSSAARQAEDMEEHRPAAPLPQPRASLRSAASSSSSSGGAAACAYVTPSGPMQQASRSAQSRSISEAERRSSVSSASAPAAPLRDFPALLAEPQPLRTHIYTHAGEGAAAPESARKERTPSSFAVAAAAPVVDGGATSSNSAQRSFSRTETQEGRGQQQARHSRRCRHSCAASLEAVPAVQLVNGYQRHVERHRRSSPCHPNGKTERDSKYCGTADGGCTFTPTLNRHSVALSDVNLERRTLYAQELQLRRRELQVLRAAVLQAATNTVAAPAVSQLSSHRATTAAGEGEAINVSPAELLTPPPPRRLVPRPCSPGSCGVGQSPSVDLSSLSSATAQLDGSSSASTLPKALQQAPPSVATTHQEAGPLTEAESGADVSFTAAAPAPSTTTTLHFHAKRPDNAVA